MKKGSVGHRFIFPGALGNPLILAGKSVNDMVENRYPETAPAWSWIQTKRNKRPLTVSKATSVIHCPLVFVISPLCSDINMWCTKELAF